MSNCKIVLINTGTSPGRSCIHGIFYRPLRKLSIFYTCHTEGPRSNAWLATKLICPSLVFIFEFSCIFKIFIIPTAKYCEFLYYSAYTRQIIFHKYACIYECGCMCAYRYPFTLQRRPFRAINNSLNCHV